MATNILFTEGEVMPYSSASAVASGAAVLVGAKLGVAIDDIAANGTGNLVMNCVISYTKATGAGTGGAQGADAYWDNPAKKITAVSTSNTKVGYFWATCADGDSTALVKLLG